MNGPGPTDEVDPTALLVDHCVLRSDDIDEFHAYIAGMEGRHERGIIGGTPVLTELRHASLGRVDFAVIYASAPMHLETVRERNASFIIQFPLSGAISIELDGQQTRVPPGRGAVLSPASHVRRRSDPGWQLALRLDGGMVRDRLSGRLGHAVVEGLSFEPLIDAAAAELRAYALLLVETIDRGIATPGSAVGSVLENGLVDLLLELQPHNYGNAVVLADAAARSARIQKVQDHLLRHLHEPIAIRDLAAAAGCSVRSLQATFAEHCGMSPMEYVKRHRLARARELLEAECSDATVTEAALRSGFAHLGRFAAEYQRLYGESPSETRRRAIMRTVKERH